MAWRGEGERVLKKGQKRRRREGLEEGLQKKKRFSSMRKKGQKRRRKRVLKKGFRRRRGLAK
jgi:hypothetical protein